MKKIDFVRQAEVWGTLSFMPPTSLYLLSPCIFYSGNRVKSILFSVRFQRNRCRDRCWGRRFKLEVQSGITSVRVRVAKVGQRLLGLQCSYSGGLELKWMSDLFRLRTGLLFFSINSHWRWITPGKEKTLVRQFPSMGQLLERTVAVNSPRTRERMPPSEGDIWAMHRIHYTK